MGGGSGESWVRPGRSKREAELTPDDLGRIPSLDPACPGCKGAEDNHVYHTRGRIQYRKCDCGTNFKTIKEKTN